MSEPARLHAVVTGHVQGVGFRMFTQQTARSLRLTGWVRNTFNDEVEVLAEGERSALEALLDHLRAGPRGAYVDHVVQEWQPYQGEYSNFTIARTY